jgi:hypothetical protein
MLTREDVTPPPKRSFCSFEITWKLPTYMYLDSTVIIT